MSRMSRGDAHPSAVDIETWTCESIWCAAAQRENDTPMRAHVRVPGVCCTHLTNAVVRARVGSASARDWLRAMESQRFRVSDGGPITVVVGHSTTTAANSRQLACTHHTASERVILTVSCLLGVAFVRGETSICVTS
jgi:hypothetical protein